MNYPETLTESERWGKQGLGFDEAVHQVEFRISKWCGHACKLTPAVTIPGAGDCPVGIVHDVRSKTSQPLGRESGYHVTGLGLLT